jgi:multiple sugar transport system substrate-binding protein
MKKIMLFVAVCSLMLSLIGCGKQNEVANISLMMWDEAQSPVIQQSIDKFNEKNEGKIVASIELVPWDTYWTKLDASLETKESADVMWMNVYLPKYATAEVVKPLDEYIEKDKLDLSQYIEGRVNAYNIDGKQYALPKGLDTVFVAYNKELFDRYGVEYPQEGWTWDDMRTIAAQLRDKIREAGGAEYPIVMELDDQPSWMNFVVQNGGNYISEDGKTTGMGMDESVEAIQNMVDLMNEELMAPYTVLSETKGTDLFVSGQGGLVFIGSWKASVLESSTLGADSNIGLIQMPALNGSNSSVLGGLGYCLSASSKHPKEAWELIKYITSEESLYNEAVNGIDIPAHAKAQEGYVKNFKNLDAQVILDASVTGFPYQSNGNFEWTSYVNDAVQKALSQIAPVKETLVEGASQAQAVLDELYK